MNIKDAIKKVGHSCRQREFLRLAGELGLAEPWTQDDVDAIRAHRRFMPGVAARMIGLQAPAFIEHAEELGFDSPYLHAEIHAVRDKITAPFPGMTSAQIAARMDVGVGWIRRNAREFKIGKWMARGCYMVDGERKRFAGRSKSFVKADVQLFLDVLPKDDARKRFPLLVTWADYNLACETAGEISPTTSPADVMSGWVEESAARARGDG